VTINGITPSGQYTFSTLIEGLAYKALNPTEKRILTAGAACAICGNSDNSTLVVDHDHDNGAVRGVLCQTCNSRLGHVETLPLEWITKAAEYVANPQVAAAREIVEHYYVQHRQDCLEELKQLDDRRGELLADIGKVDKRISAINRRFQYTTIRAERRKP
jgi:hypothetical protein